MLVYLFRIVRRKAGSPPREIHGRFAYRMVGLCGREQARGDTCG